MGGAAIHLSWLCPETERVMADALYYRAIAYAETGNLKAAEADMRTMVDKGNRLGYSPGDAVLAVAWKRLGDFYRTRLKDEARALEAYRKALESKSSPGTRDVLKSAAESAAEILHKQGRSDEARKLKQASQ
jgi:tetratricopeptide (TPR) repeat protein